MPILGACFVRVTLPRFGDLGHAPHESLKFCNFVRYWHKKADLIRHRINAIYVPSNVRENPLKGPLTGRSPRTATYGPHGLEGPPFEVLGVRV